MNIVKFPDPILRERMPEFDFANPSHNPEQLEAAMIAKMFAHDGISLAANQVGIRARMFVMGWKENPEGGIACFNPEVIANTDAIEDLEEDV